MHGKYSGLSGLHLQVFPAHLTHRSSLPTTPCLLERWGPLLTHWAGSCHSKFYFSSCIQGWLLWAHLTDLCLSFSTKKEGFKHDLVPWLRCEFLNRNKEKYSWKLIYNHAFIIRCRSRFLDGVLMRGFVPVTVLPC